MGAVQTGCRPPWLWLLLSLLICVTLPLSNSVLVVPPLPVACTVVPHRSALSPLCAVVPPTTLCAAGE